LVDKRVSAGERNTDLTEKPLGQRPWEAC
jgi:hypothetical protein